ncbi:MAG: Prolyl tripeptidyl peptidase precursor [Planctomycetota bacterium]
MDGACGRRLRLGGAHAHGDPLAQVAPRLHDVVMRCAAAVFLALLASCSALLRAQGTAADHEFASRLGELFRGKVHEFPREVHWAADSSRVWFTEVHRDGTRSFVTVAVADGVRKPAFDAPRFAQAWSALQNGEVDPQRLPVELEHVDADGSVRVRAGSKRWRFGSEGELAPADDEAPVLKPMARQRPSRNGGRKTDLTFVNQGRHDLKLVWWAGGGEKREYGVLPAGEERTMGTFVGHVWLLVGPAETVVAAYEAAAGNPRAVVGDGAAQPRDRAAAEARQPARKRARVVHRDHNLFVVGADGAEKPLTTDGTAEHFYRGDLHVSPDGSRLLAFREKPAQQRLVTLVESSPRDQLQPKVHTLDYLKPGDRIAEPSPCLFDLAEARAIPLDASRWPNPWALHRVRWAPDGSEVYLLYDQRGHQLQRLDAIDARTGEVRTVVEEKPATFVDYSQKTWLHWLDGGRELLWASERSGHNHVWRIDIATGKAAPVTSGNWVVRKVEHVDEAAGELWFTAYGIHPAQDPYHAHLARVKLDGTGLVVVTAADGTHEWSLSPDRSHAVVRWSRVDHVPVTELRRTRDGALVCELGRDDATKLLATGWRPPVRFVAKGRDGTTDIHGFFVRPVRFDPAKKYPVIESIYAGPHDFHVPKAWSVNHGSRELAELGFIVVKVDGMGTNWRSKSFHDVCWRNLKDAGFPDRIAWMRAAAAVHPELDLTRVGIFGGSAGGQNALAALLHHGDFYKAAAADCGCHDNRMDKIWWNEAWMGWPVGEWYADSSNVVHAPKLTGRLLLTVGELDRNVDPASTLQVADALIRAGKEFELAVVPGGGHGAGGIPAMVRKRNDLFIRSLWGVEPRQ